MIDLETKWFTFTIDTDLVEPRAIAVDPRVTEKRLYFTDKHGIYRAGLDGAWRETVIDTDLADLNGLSIGRRSMDEGRGVRILLRSPHAKFSEESMRVFFQRN